MKVRDAMSADVELANPGQTIREAALRMLECDIGALPVGEHDRLVGMLTAVGLSPDTPVSEVMSRDVKYCFDDEELKDVATNMGAVQVRRLPVVDRDKRLVGIVSLGDVAVCEKPQTTGKAVAGVSVPGGAHSQATH
jgi:CBS domain-containing protein